MNVLHACLLSTATVSLVLSGPARADEMPDNLEKLLPSTEWNIDFGENTCRLARVFGEGENKHILFVEQAGPSESFNLTIAGPGMKKYRQIITRLTLKPDEGFPQTYGNPAEVVGYGPGEVFTSLKINEPDESTDGALRTLPHIDLDEAAAIERVVYGHGGSALSFETGEMASPFQALNVCSADFVRAWGLDEGEHQSFEKMAVWKNEADIAKRIQKKYTRAALKRGEQAILRMRVIVETDGSVSDCTLTDATETERLESNACDEMAKAEFAPALDKAGNPMRSFYLTNIIYRIFGASADGTRPRL